MTIHLQERPATQTDAARFTAHPGRWLAAGWITIAILAALALLTATS